MKWHKETLERLEREIGDDVQITEEVAKEYLKKYNSSKPGDFESRSETEWLKFRQQLYLTGNKRRNLTAGQVQDQNDLDNKDDDETDVQNQVDTNSSSSPAAPPNPPVSADKDLNENSPPNNTMIQRFGKPTNPQPQSFIIGTPVNTPNFPPPVLVGHVVPPPGLGPQPGANITTNVTRGSNSTNSTAIKPPHIHPPTPVTQPGTHYPDSGTNHSPHTVPANNGHPASDRRAGNRLDSTNTLGDRSSNNRNTVDSLDVNTEFSLDSVRELWEHILVTLGVIRRVLQWLFTHKLAVGIGVVAFYCRRAIVGICDAISEFGRDVQGRDLDFDTLILVVIAGIGIVCIVEKAIQWWRDYKGDRTEIHQAQQTQQLHHDLNHSQQQQWIHQQQQHQQNAVSYQHQQLQDPQHTTQHNIDYGNQYYQQENSNYHPSTGQHQPPFQHEQIITPASQHTPRQEDVLSTHNSANSLTQNWPANFDAEKFKKRITQYDGKTLMVEWMSLQLAAGNIVEPWEEKAFFDAILGKVGADIQMKLVRLNKEIQTQNLIARRDWLLSPRIYASVTVVSMRAWRRPMKNYSVLDIASAIQFEISQISLKNLRMLSRFQRMRSVGSSC